MRLPPIPLNIPRTITPGDTVTWRDSFAEYKPPDYSLSWAIRGACILDLNAIAVGDEFETTITPTASSNLTPGTYFYQAYTRYVGGRITVGSGQITVRANLESTLASYEGSTTAEKMLAAVEAAIQARLSGGAVDSYEIKGRRLDRTPLPDLVVLRSQLKIEVQREQAAAGLMADPRRLHIRFKGAS